MARATWIAVLAVAAIVVSGCGGGHSKAGARVEHPAVLSLVNGGASGSDPVGIWAHEVETLSHGKLQVPPGREIAPAADVERRVVAQVRSGRIEFGLVGARVFDLLGDRDFQALATPMLIDS